MSRGFSRLLFPTLLLVCLLEPRIVKSENILGIFSYTFGSSYLLIEPYLRQLVHRGHQLTIISAVTHLPHIEGAHHIRVARLDQQMQDLLDYDYEFELSKWMEAQFVSDYFFNCSKFILEDPGVQELLLNKSAEYSMVILEAAHTDALYGFAQHFNAPLVGIAAFGSAWNIDFLAGNSAPSVYEPMSALGYSPGLNLLEKWYNLIFITEERLVERFVYLPRQIDLYKKHFSDGSGSLHEIRRKFSLILINQHFSLGRVRSNVPNLVEVAGMHLAGPPEPLDDELRTFIEGAEHGVIYFSMGLQMLDKWLPPGLPELMIECFKRLKQRVIWKRYDETIANNTRNVYVSGLLPQREILNHPNVKLFITHGGLLSIIEAAHYAVPTLCLPLFFDQFQNTKRMEKMGVARSLDITDISQEVVLQAIGEMLNTSNYKQRALDLSGRFHDQPMSPIDTAVWWTEYVLRHKGADHMRIAEQEMSLMQYYNVDIISVLFGRIGFSALIVVVLAWKLVSFATRNLEYRFNLPMVR